MHSAHAFHDCFFHASLHCGNAGQLRQSGAAGHRETGVHRQVLTPVEFLDRFEERVEVGGLKLHDLDQYAISGTQPEVCFGDIGPFALKGNSSRLFHTRLKTQGN